MGMAGQRQAGIIRDFEMEDIGDVARLFQVTFRASHKPSADLKAHLEQAFFAHPWAEPDIRSKVFTGPDGRAVGFVGVFPARLELEGRPLRAALAGSMVVEDPKGNPLAGARLLRAVLSGPQDISLTETANHTALGMWQKAGYPLDTGYSFNWLRVLRPASAMLDIVARRAAPAGLLLPFGRMADRAAGLLRQVPFEPQRSGQSRTVFTDVPLDAFRDALLALARHYPLHPRWDETSLDWFLRQAEEKRKFGFPEWRVGHSPNGSIAGAYAYFSRPGGIAWVLQALCAPGTEGELVEDMFVHAHAMGASGLRGAAHPWLIPALMSRKTLFYGRTFYIAQARDKALLEPIRDGRALISGIAGESWTRLIGDRFDEGNRTE
jgi:hypothetical protein